METETETLVADLRRMIDQLLRLIDEKDSIHQQLIDTYYKEVEKNIALEKELKLLRGY